MAVFNQSILLISIHILLVAGSFFFFKTDTTLIKKTVIDSYQELEWSKLVNIFSVKNKFIALQKIKPRWDIFGFELSLEGNYNEFNQWIVDLHHQYPYLNWSHIRLSQKSKLIIEMVGFGYV